MGLGNYGKKVLYLLSGLTRKDVVDIGLKLMQKRLANGETNTVSRPTIDVDCNNIINVVGRSRGDPVGAVVTHLSTWAQHGLIMSPICDGDTRPTAKQASNNHRAIREKNRNKAVVSRQELREVSRILAQEEMNAERRSALIKNRETLEKSIKSAETQSVRKSFPELLEKRLAEMKLHDVNNAGGSVGKVMTAEFQADSLMVGRYLSGLCQLLMSNDADFTVFCGDGSAAVKGFTGKYSTLSSTCRNTLEEIISYLEPASQERVKLEVPPFPIFEGIEDRKLRILLAVILGCDVSPGGVKDVGPAKILNKMKEIHEDEENSNSIYDQMVDYAVEMSKPGKTKPPKYSAEVINVLVEAVLYEPTNEEPAEKPSSYDYRTYMEDTPEKLVSYLGEFKSSTTTIVDGPEVLKCKGPCSDGSACHKFLAAEDHHKCIACSEVVCDFCSEKKGSGQYCLACHIVESLLPGIDLNDLLTVSQMREELKKKYNFDDVDQLSIEEVEDAWASHALHREIEELAGKVKFPVCPTSAITSGKYWEKLVDIDFSFGGSFLLDEKIDEKYIPAILDLFASFVAFGSDDTKHTNWQNDGAVYSAMPKMFLDFAKECRLNLGYRLLRRCIRHAMDTRTESLDNKVAQLVLYNDGELGIQLSTPVPASMKKDVYDGTTVVTKDKLLCSECECKSGSKEEDKVACVHTMVRPFLLTILLQEDLAENMLLELCQMLTSANIENDTWSEDEIASMKKSIIIFMEASGNSSIAEGLADNVTLFDMLKSFQTGTQKTNEWKRVHKPPSKDEIGPITNIIFDSPEHKAKVLFRRASPKPNLDPTEEIVTFEPDYIQAGIVLNAAGFHPSKYDYVGFKLFEERRKKQPMDHDSYAEKLSMATQEWKKLKDEAQQRSMRCTESQLDNISRPRKRKSKASVDEIEVVPTPRKSPRLLSIADCGSDVSATPSPKKKSNSGPSGRSPSKMCVKVGCKVNSDNKPAGTSFHRVPPYPSDPPADASIEELITHRGKLELRREVMERAGHGRDDKTTAEMRICSCHPIEIVKTTLPIKYDGETYYQRYEMTLIHGAGSESSLLPSTTTKGVGKDRFIHNQLRVLQNMKGQESSTISSSDEQEASELEVEQRRRIDAEKSAAEAWLVAQQVVECHSHDTANGMNIISPSVSNAAGFVEPNKSPDMHPMSKRLFKVKRIGKPPRLPKANYHHVYCHVYLMMK